MYQVHLFCFLASYSAAFVLELSRLWQSKKWLHWMSIVATMAGLTAQTWYLIARSAESQLPPLLSSYHDWLLVSAWLLITGYLLYVILNLKKAGSDSLGLFVLPVALLMVIGSSLLTTHVKSFAEGQQVVRMLHASSLSIGIVGVLIGFLISLMYLIQHRRLKKKHTLHRGFSLPPLSSLAKYNRWMVMLSMPMLTIGLVTGFVLIANSDKAENPFSWQDPIVIGFTVIWLAMVVLFGWLLKSHSHSGREIALLNAWAFGFLIVTLLGLQFIVMLTGIPTQHG
ncbi:cytochrome c biogenesis protein CcsA [Rubinisphaera sp.]|uniref:cytochrome c biogenesis protein CcsA n=1 Tax=Rubinisphaera sp. TaxID=2024857 RepID=UPI000C103B7F|nr:cytochrome c biogenesis protein CcsA [Rubinisphaera sp.]MBV07715.1 hypothetical protein [Rubinisphaera sp.]|tara:strand:- start:1301 stop:2149 length:849 start_codon:yes stop_codon:yes gene_type:complete